MKNILIKLINYSIASSSGASFLEDMFPIFSNIIYLILFLTLQDIARPQLGRGLGCVCIDDCNEWMVRTLV